MTKVTYMVQIKRLLTPYNGEESIKTSERYLTLDESPTPYGAFRVGDTLNHEFDFLGEVQHVHHTIGGTRDNVLQVTVVYFFEPPR
jgi:hypothetical protein